MMLLLLTLLSCVSANRGDSATPEVFPTPKADTADSPAAATGVSPLDCDAEGGVGTVWTGTEEPVPVLIWEHSDGRWLQPTALEFDPGKQAVVWRLAGASSTCLAWGM